MGLFSRKSKIAKKPTPAWFKWGMIAALVSAGVFFGGPLLAMATAFVTSLWSFLAVAIPTALVGMFLLNGRIQTALWYLWNGIIEGAENFFVDNNRLSILRGYIRKSKTKLQKIKRHKGTLAANKSRLDNKVKRKGKELDGLRNKYEALKKKTGKVSDWDDRKINDNIGLIGEKVGILTNAIGVYKEHSQRNESMYEVIDRLEHYITKMVDRMEFQVENEEELYHTVLASYKAMNSARELTSGQGNDKVLFEKAMDSLINNTGEKMGRMDDMMKEFDRVINNIDLEDAAQQENGLKILQEWDQKMNEDMKSLESATIEDEILLAAKHALEEDGEEVIEIIREKDLQSNNYM